MNKFLFFSVMLLVSQNVSAETWQQHLIWSQNDDGPADCGPQYAALGGDAHNCLNAGNRRCLMTVAGIEAGNGNYGKAYQIVLVTQCHNASAQKSIQAAGQKKVGDWLSGKDSGG